MFAHCEYETVNIMCMLVYSQIIDLTPLITKLNRHNGRIYFFRNKIDANRAGNLGRIPMGRRAV